MSRRHPLDGALVCSREGRDERGRFGPLHRDDLGYLQVHDGGQAVVFWFDGDLKQEPGYVDDVELDSMICVSTPEREWRVWPLALRGKWEPTTEQRLRCWQECPISLSEVPG